MKHVNVKSSAVYKYNRLFNAATKEYDIYHTAIQQFQHFI